MNNCWNIIRRIEYSEIRKKVARLLALKKLYRYKAHEFFPFRVETGLKGSNLNVCGEVVA